MAVTLKKIEYHNVNVEYDKKKKLYTFINDASIVYYFTKNKKDYSLKLSLKKGFRTDGASIPSWATWFLPKWDPKHMEYNCGAIVHDVFYTTKGIDGVFTREECDDFFRGAVRLAGYGRFKAGVADKALEWFGDGPTHWGSDDLENKAKQLFCFELV